MGKYAGCLTTEDVCKLELEELGGICARYHMLDEDKAALRGMVIEPYFQLTQSYSSARAMERLITEKTGGTLSVEDFYKYIQYHQEEEQKYPFAIGGDGDAE